MLTTCPPAVLDELVAKFGEDENQSMAALEQLLKAYSDDPRLHFLQGSLLATRRDFIGAQKAMRRAVDLAPDYAVARFQLGLLLLSSGEPFSAQEVWGPLHRLDSDDHLRLFASALIHLMHDEWSEALDGLRQGMHRNVENIAMNEDMALIAEEIQKKMLADDREDDNEAMSSVHHLLRQSAWKTQH